MDTEYARIGNKDGGLYTVFGSTRLRVADEVVSDRPGIRAYEGRRVIAGIRPENMEDASIMPVIPEDRRMKVDIVLREALGSEVRALRTQPVGTGQAAAPVDHSHLERLVREGLASRYEADGVVTYTAA
jgi:hypothetical protein